MKYVQLKTLLSTPSLESSAKEQVLKLYQESPDSKLALYLILQEAARQSDLIMLKFLLNDCGISISSVLGTNNSSILYSVKDQITAELLISYKASINALGLYNEIPLHRAANKDLAKLYSTPTNINKQSDLRDTPLHTAARDGRTDVVEFLLSKGANVNLVNISGQTALHNAANVKTAELLIAAGVNVNAGDNKGRAALHLARDRELAKFLIKKGAHIDQADQQGKTALHWALESYDKKDLVKALLDLDADIYIKDKEGRTPLHKVKDCDIANFLFTLYPDLNAGTLDTPDNLGRTPLQHAIDQGKKSLASLFIKAGANAKQTGENGKTLLHLAHNSESAKLLIEKGVDINQPDTTGKVPLYYALYDSKLEVAQFLIDRGAAVTQAEKDLILKLHVEKDNLNAVEFLLNFGANINQLDSNNNNLLYFALYHEQIAMAKLLISKGLDLTQVHKDFLLTFSVQNGFQEAAELLVEFGSNVKQLDSGGKNLLYVSIIHLHKTSAEFFYKTLDLRITPEEEEQLLLDAIDHPNKARIELMTALLSCDINKIDSDGKTLLAHSVIKGNKDLIDYLITKGARLDLINKDELLNEIIIKGKSHQLVAEWLIEQGVNIDKALVTSVSSANIAITELLIKLCANVLQTDESGKSLLYLAPNPTTAELLIDANPLILKQEEAAGKTALHSALRSNKREVAEFLIKKGADLSQGEKDKLLIEAAQNGHVNSAEVLINIGAHVNQVGTNPLHITAQRGDVAIAKLLVAKGASFKHLDSTGKTALYCTGSNPATEFLALTMIKQACASYNQADFDLALTKLANINAKDEEEKTALIYTVSASFDYGFNQILRKAPNLNIRDNQGNTALMHTALNGNYNIAWWLLQKGADFNIRDNAGKTPLYNAVYNSRENIASELLKKGATFDQDDKTPLLKLISYRSYAPPDLSAPATYIGIMKALIAAGADIHDNILHSTSSVEAANLLIVKGANVHARDNYGKTPLFHAVNNNNLALVNFMLGKGLKFDETDKNVLLRTLSEKWYNKCTELIDILVRAGADVNCGVLHVVSTYEIANRLIYWGANIHAKAPEQFFPSWDHKVNKNPLYCHVCSNRKDIVQLLISRGAKFDEVDKNPLLKVAVRNNNQELAQILINAGAKVNEGVLGDANSVAMAQWLINRGAEVEKVDSEGHTAIYYAAIGKYNDVVDFLVKKAKGPLNADALTAMVHNCKGSLVQEALEKMPALIDHKDKDGATPFINAIKRADDKVVELLLGLKPDLIDTIDKDGNTSLHILAKVTSGALVAKNQILSVLIKAKPALLDSINNHGDTALHLCMGNWGNREISCSLISQMSVHAVDLSNKSGQTALHIAMTNGYQPIATKQLLNKMTIPTINATDRSGNTALHLAAKIAYNESMPILVSKMTQEAIDSVDSYGNTALHHAACHASPKFVRLLLDNMSPEVINKLGANGYTALHNLSSIEVLNELLTKVDHNLLNVKDSSGNTVLVNAVSRAGGGYYLDILQRLLQLVDPNTVNEKNNIGQTALYYAGNAEVASMLIRLMNQDSINSADNSGWTALHMAAHKGWASVVDVLLRSMSQEAIKTPDHSGKVALLMSSTLEVFDKLYSKEAVNSVDKYGNTILHSFTFSYNSGPLITRVLGSIDPKLIEAKNHSGYSALQEGVKRGHNIFVEIFLNKFPHYIKEKDVHGKTLLHLVAPVGNIKLYEFLLSKDPSLIDTLDNNNGTIIVPNLLYSHHTAAVSMLLQKIGSAVLNTKDKSSYTILHNVASDDIGILILNSGKIAKGTYGVTNSQEQTALHSSVAKGLTHFSQRLLAQMEADAVNKVDIWGRTIFHHASNDSTLKILLANSKVDKDIINQPDKTGFTPLHLAAMNGNNPARVEIIKTLLVNMSQEAIDSIDRYGKTALHYAPNDTIVELLLSKMTPTLVNEADLEGNTPLHCAAISGFSKTASSLVTKMDSNSIIKTNKQGETALHCAAGSNREEIFKMLVGFMSIAAIILQNNKGQTAIDKFTDQEREILRDEVLIQKGLKPMQTLHVRGSELEEKDQASSDFAKNAFSSALSYINEDTHAYNTSISGHVEHSFAELVF